MDAQSTILVVDSNKSRADGIIAVLAGLPAKTVVAYTQKDALKFLEKENVDCVLSQLNLDGPVDGLTLIDEAKKISPGCEVLIVAENPSLETCKDAIRKGAFDYHAEPIDNQQLRSIVLQACRKEQIHTAVETAAYCPEGVFLELMALVDFAFIDIKHMNTERHREKTGVSNERILGNIRALVRSGWPGRLVLRMPVIAGYNDSEENIAATLRFMQRLGLAEINILPFHRMGDSKWAQLGASYACRKNPATPETKLRVLQDKFLDQRIACYVGPDTLF